MTFEHALIHTCTIQARALKHKLFFKTGTVAFTNGETITGATASGVVDRFVLSTGAWGSGTAAGYVILKTVSGTFVDSEALTGTSTGRANANGANAAFANSTGEKEYYWATSIADVRVKFYWISRRVRLLESGEEPIKVLMCWIPGSLTISEDDYRITTTTTGFTGTYEIKSLVPKPWQTVATHHYEAELSKVVN